MLAQAIFAAQHIGGARVESGYRLAAAALLLGKVRIT
jgi:hypothetical protein